MVQPKAGVILAFRHHTADTLRAFLILPLTSGQEFVLVTTLSPWNETGQCDARTSRSHRLHVH
jgi:hypothetical protein